MTSHSPFEITGLKSDGLLRLYGEVTSYVQSVGIEVVASRRSQQNQEKHPATTIGLTNGNPIVRLVDSLNRGQRIEAIAHELLHLLLVYRFGLGVIGRKIPSRGKSEDVFNFYMSMRGDWVFLLGQIINTVHHLILVDYLKKEYGVQSSLHLRLLHHNFGIILSDHSRDKETLYAKGLIAFEYERLIGKVNGVMNIFRQTDPFWQAYHLAQKYFEKYGFLSIPTPLSYQENILSFLEALGYPREDFIFLAEGKKDNPCAKFTA